MITHRPLATIQIPGAFPRLGVHNGQLYCSTGVAGSPWRLVELSPSLALKRSVTGGINPNGALQFGLEDGFAHGWEMRPGPTWTRQAVNLATFQASALGEDWAGNQTVRSGYRLTTLPGQAWLDNVPLVLPFDPAGEAKLGEDGWVLARDHANAHVAVGLLGQWQPPIVAQGGGALDAALVDGTSAAYSLVKPFDLDGPLLEAAPWTRESVAGVYRDEAGDPWLVTCCFHEPSGRFFVFLRPFGEPRSIVLERPNQDSWASWAVLGTVAYVATFVAGVTTIDAIDLRAARVIPTEPEASSGPTPPDPTPGPLVLLVSADSGMAPLRVQASVYEATVDRPVTFWRRKQPAVAWTLVVDRPSEPEAPPTHFFEFEEPGTYDLQATQVGRPKSNIRSVTVVPVPAPAPEPEPEPKPAWWVLLLRAIFGNR
jgi:hypothetical protein